MNCSSCGSPLVDDARFCPACGAPVAGRCLACGRALPDGARFCPFCGAPTGAPDGPRSAAAPGAGPARERRIATILFADLVGFTGLNEAHDPELVQAWVARAFDRLSDEVDRYEGLVEKFAGDAMLALFGVPRLHEDDAERAVRAALEMQGAMGALAVEARTAGRPELGLRIGVETGEVLVALDRVATERDRLVTGDAVNTAARLQQTAASGEVVVGSGTYAATRDLIEYEEVAPATLKGKTAPVARWRAVRVKARRGGRMQRLGLEAPLVGRDEEMTLLKGHVRRAVADRRPQLVTVIGSAGVGKSRLGWELEKYLDGLPEPYVWRKGRCLAYGQAAYGAVAEIVRADAGITDGSPENDVRDRLEERLTALGFDRDATGSSGLHALIGLGEPVDIQRATLFETWRHYIEALARLAPAVLVLEDIHWADEGTLDFIEHLARWSDGPIVLVCLARHELLERRPSWGGGIANAATVVLEPLDADESAALVQGLLPGGLPERLCDRIVGLAEGNPLFTEELVRMFVDQAVVRFAEGRWHLASAVDELDVPGSVHAVLAARLDALSPQEKAVAQDAAVVGRVFWDAVLQYLAGDRPAPIDELLRRLRLKELVVPREPSSLSGASEFGFRHVLVRDVAYDSLPKRERAAKHRSVAEWAERELGEGAEEAAQLLASHYLSALRYEEEFGGAAATIDELRRRTYRYARRAAERSDRLYEREGATRWMRIAHELARKLDVPAAERAVVAMEVLERAAGNLPLDEASQVADEALSLIADLPAATPDVLETEARIRAVAAFALLNLGEQQRAQEVLRTGIARAEPGPPTPGRALLLARLGWTQWRLGPGADAIPTLERAIAEAKDAGADRVLAWAMQELGIVFEQTDRAGEGIPLLRESLRLATLAGDHTLGMRAHINLTSTLMSHGAPWQELIPELEDALRAAQQAADRVSEGWILWQLAELTEWLGRFDEEEQYTRLSLDLARAAGERQQISVRESGLGWIAALRGRWDEARRIHERASESAAPAEAQAQVFERIWEAWSAWRDDPDVAVDHLARTLPEVPVEAQLGAWWLARMAYRTGRPDALAIARRLLPPDALPHEGPIRVLERRGVGELTGGSPHGTNLFGIAEDMDELGYRFPAACVYADAALALAREGSDAGVALVRAREVHDAIGLAPLLGRLPETRWIGAPATPTVASGPA